MTIKTAVSNLMIYKSPGAIARMYCGADAMFILFNLPVGAWRSFLSPAYPALLSRSSKLLPDYSSPSPAYSLPESSAYTSDMPGYSPGMLSNYAGDSLSYIPHLRQRAPPRASKACAKATRTT